MLLADDNADMRDYICRLLRRPASGEAVADGQRRSSHCAGTDRTWC